MIIDTCPECQSLWEEYQACVSKIHQLRELAEIALLGHEKQSAKRIQVELDSLEQISVGVRQNLMEHQRAVHMRMNR